CIITIITSSCPCVAKSNNSTVTHTRLAILSSEEVRECGLGDLSTVAIQELPNVELVERDLLQKALDEVALSMMLGADQVENRRQAGVLLKADMLVLLSLEEAKSKKPTVKIVISDCSNGARLRIGWIPFNKDELENSCRDLTKIVHNTLERFKDGVKQIVGVSHLVSRNLVHDYDHLQAGYAYLLQNALSSSPGVAVIEVEEARSIRHESELAGDIKSGRVVPLFVEGEFRMQRAASKKQGKVQITIRISDSVGAIKQIERKDLSMDKVAAFITDDAALTILKLSKSPSVQMLDKEQQLQALIRNADEFARLGAGEHSTGLREAAVLLKPDSAEQRIKLFDEYIQILRLRFQSSAPSWLVPNEWRPSSEHLEYVIYNRMIDRKKARELSSRFLTHLPSVGRWARTQSPMPEELYRKDFLRRVYPEILKLKPHSTETRYQQRECAQWHDLLASNALKGGLAHRKEGLAFFLDLHNKAVPEGVGPSSYFVRFLKRDFYSAGYKLQHNRPRYTRQEFLDFLTALSHSEKTLSSFYGRYGLLYHKYRQKKHQGKAMDDLRD
ncbi:hypothetical protein KA005_80390, partial [bacterium]|nr:hypothetical protein [bacterium]